MQSNFTNVNNIQGLNSTGTIRATSDYGLSGTMLFDILGNLLECDDHAMNFFEAPSKRYLCDNFYSFSPNVQPNKENSEFTFIDNLNQVFTGVPPEFIWLFRTEKNVFKVAEVLLRADADETIKCSIIEFCPESSNILPGQQVVDDLTMYIMDRMPFFFGFIDLNLNLININNAGMQTFKFNNKGEFIKNYLDIFPYLQPCGTTSLQKMRYHIASALKYGTATFEWLQTDKENNEIPGEIRLVRVEESAGKYLMTIFFRDLRNRYRLQRSQARVKERLEAILDSSPLCCFILNKNFKIVDCNLEVLSLFELKSKKEFTNNFHQLYPIFQPDGRMSMEKMREKLKQLMSSGRVYFEWMSKTITDKEIPSEITGVKVNLDSEDMAIVYVRDLREIKNAVKMVEHLNHLAFTDPLTGANNRRFFNESAEKAMNNCLRENSNLSFIMLDIDDFKKVNDTYGHIVGDEVLKILVSRIQNVLRRDTALARYGGEEFMVTLPDIDHESAVKTAWRIQGRVASSDFVIDEKQLKITVSLGVASRNEGMYDLTELITHADQALYAAKTSGKNTVKSYNLEHSF